MAKPFPIPCSFPCPLPSPVPSSALQLARLVQFCLRISVSFNGGCLYLWSKSLTSGFGDRIDRLIRRCQIKGFRFSSLFATNPFMSPVILQILPFDDRSLAVPSSGDHGSIWPPIHLMKQCTVLCIRVLFVRIFVFISLSMPPYTFHTNDISCHTLNLFANSAFCILLQAAALFPISEQTDNMLMTFSVLQIEFQFIIYIIYIHIYI